MIRILFVDDEPRVLDGLQRLLRAQRHEWDMQFSTGAEDALRLLAAAPVDVVVTDMRMPGMDGAELLHRVNEQFPGIMRIVLSGQFDVDAGLRAVPVAHQFLTKPCDPEKLKAAIGRCVPDNSTRKLVSSIGALPSPPRTCLELMQAVQDPERSMSSIGRMIHLDVAVTAKVLQLANSAFFNLPHQVTDVESAVHLLGLDVLRQLILSAEILRQFRPARAIPGFSLDAFERHSQMTAAIAAGLLPEGPERSVGLMAALLHDAGKLVLATRMPAEFEEAIARAERERRPVHECEFELMGAHHGQIGGYLLNLWGLPIDAVQAISLHHVPLRQPPRDGRLTLAATVHLADALANEEGIPAALLPPVPADLTPDFLAVPEVAALLPSWRALAQQCFTG